MVEVIGPAKVERIYIMKDVSYEEALARVNDLKASGYASVPRFQKVKTFEVQSD